MKSKINIKTIENYWENNPLSSDAIPFEPGTPEFFEEHTRLRNQIEPAPFQEEVYEWRQHSREKVLDVGCGTGFVVALYARGEANVTGIDIAKRSVELTNRRLELSGLTAKVQQADAENLPFEDNCFDLVTSFGVLHHTPDTCKAVQEVYRVLKPGGKTILMFYNRNSFAYQVLFRAKRWLQPSWWGKSAQEQVNAVDGPANPLGKVYSKNDLKRILSDFEQLDFKTGLLFFRWETVMPRGLVSFITRRWGWFLYVKAYKPTSDHSQQM